MFSQMFHNANRVVIAETVAPGSPRAVLSYVFNATNVMLLHFHMENNCFLLFQFLFCLFLLFCCQATKIAQKILADIRILLYCRNVHVSRETNTPT